jgi:phosphatidylglycerol:prolipoprotein diacylglycerol transferase
MTRPSAAGREGKNNRMRSTLFHIPLEVAGMPLFGFGLLLAVWAVFSVVVLAVLIRRQGFNADTQSYLPILAMFGLVILFLPKIADPAGLPIRGFGLMLLLAVVSGVGLAMHRARQMKVDPELILSLAFWLFSFGIIGARLFYVVQKWPTEFSGRYSGIELLFALVNVTQGGLVVYGSVIGAALGLLIFCRRNRLSLLALSDLIAPSLALGLALGRVGCFLNGCCFGGICDLPWAVQFPWQSPPHIRQVQQGQLDLFGMVVDGSPGAAPVIKAVVPGSLADAHGMKPGDRITHINGRPIAAVYDAQRELLEAASQPQLSIAIAGQAEPKQWIVPDPLPRSRPVHPAQLYSTVDALVLCLLLWAYYPFRRRDGEVTALLITIYPITRFLIEALRTDEPKNIFGMSISQNISLLLLALAAALWIYLWRQPAGTAFGQRIITSRPALAAR